MALIVDVKVKRKILSVIAKYLKNIHFFFKKIIVLHIFDFSFQLSSNKGKRCQKICNNRLLKTAMSSNKTVPSTKKIKAKNKWEEKIVKKIKIY